MSALLRKHRTASIGGGPAVIARPPPAGKVMAAWRAAGTTQDGAARNGFLRVLVVDDNRDAADSWSMLLKLWGHDAGVAYEGGAALAMAADVWPDVMLVDIGMPRMDGFQLARHLRQQIRFTDTLLIAVTGWADQAHRLLWEDAFDHYLIKPVDPPALEILLLDRVRQVRARTGGEPRRSPALGPVAACVAVQSKVSPNSFLKENSTCYG
jgi:CheY-like chemotaxis protein